MRRDPNPPQNQVPDDNYDEVLYLKENKGDKPPRGFFCENC